MKEEKFHDWTWAASNLLPSDYTQTPTGVCQVVRYFFLLLSILLFWSTWLASVIYELIFINYVPFRSFIRAPLQSLYCNLQLRKLTEDLLMLFINTCYFIYYNGSTVYIHVYSYAMTYNARSRYSHPESTEITMYRFGIEEHMNSNQFCNVCISYIFVLLYFQCWSCESHYSDPSIHLFTPTEKPSSYWLKFGCVYRTQL